MIEFEPCFHSHLYSDNIAGINSLLLHHKRGHATVGDFRAALRWSDATVPLNGFAQDAAHYTEEKLSAAHYC